MWVAEVDASAYADFLWRLYRRVADPSPGWTQWMPMGQCSFDATLAPDDHEDDTSDTEGEVARVAEVEEMPISKGKKSSTEVPKIAKTEKSGVSKSSGAKRGGRKSGRKQVALLAKQRTAAASKIQARARGKAGRGKAKTRHQAAVKVQAARRGQVARSSLPVRRTVAKSPALSAARPDRESSEHGIEYVGGRNEHLAFGSTQSRFAAGRSEITDGSGLGLASWAGAQSGGGDGGWRYWGEGDGAQFASSTWTGMPPPVQPPLPNASCRRPGNAACTSCSGGELTYQGGLEATPSQFEGHASANDLRAPQSPVAQLYVPPARPSTATDQGVAGSWSSPAVHRPRTQESSLRHYSTKSANPASELRRLGIPPHRPLAGNSARRLPLSRSSSLPAASLPARKRPSPIIPCKSPRFQLSYLTETYADDKLSELTDADLVTRRAEARIITAAAESRMRANALSGLADNGAVYGAWAGHHQRLSSLPPRYIQFLTPRLRAPVWISAQRLTHSASSGGLQLHRRGALMSGFD